VSVTPENPTPGQSGLAALVLLLRFHGVGADPEQIRHRFGTDRRRRNAAVREGI
jgi:ABC-type bacteriocin/lantibiotic exporter with double-glycine peptidase domain